MAAGGRSSGLERPLPPPPGTSWHRTRRAASLKAPSALLAFVRVSGKVTLGGGAGTATLPGAGIPPTPSPAPGALAAALQALVLSHLSWRAGLHTAMTGASACVSQRRIQGALWGLLGEMMLPSLRPWCQTGRIKEPWPEGDSPRGRTKPWFIAQRGNGRARPQPPPILRCLSQLHSSPLWPAWLSWAAGVPDPALPVQPSRQPGTQRAWWPCLFYR